MFLRILISIIIISIKTTAAHDLWVNVESPTTKTLFNCILVDSLNGWAAGDSGIIIHTSNGGKSFVIQSPPVNYYINDIHFINKRLGWAVANEFLLNGTTILKTTNGGFNWTAEQFPDSNKIFRTVHFLDSLNGFLAGFAGTIFKTTDAGNNWFETEVDSSDVSTFPIQKISFVNKDVGFACGGYIDIAGIMWKTTNGGLLWSAESLSPEPFYSIYIRDDLRILSVGGDFEYGVQMTRTTNAGANWQYESLEMFGQAESIDFRTPREGWMALSYAASWAVSYDSGETWSSIPVINKSVIKSVSFSDSLHGFAVGNDGVILRYDPKPVSVNSESSVVPSHFKLSQNYPNPFNPVTNLELEIPASQGGSDRGFVSIKIYDVLGNEVATLVNELLSPGNYNYQLSTDNYQLSSGIYFYSLFVNGSVINTKKMILLK